jgi:site-specific DNA recombinase
MRIAMYIRVSTQRQAQTQTSEQQLERLQAHARQQNWIVPLENIFRDDGYSGATLKRPGLDRLRDRVADRELDLILITAPDRLARNFVHQVLLLEEIEKYGCQVHFLDRPMSQDPHDQLLLQIRGAVAEYERSLISDRMRRGRQRKLEAGLLLPWKRPLYGYRMDPDHPRDPAGVRVEETEAAVVRDLFAWYAEDTCSFFELARRLHRLGIMSPMGRKHWNLNTIHNMLTNPTYTGQVYANRWHRIGTLKRRSAILVPQHRSEYTRVNAPRQEWTFVTTVPALVSQEVYDRVQAKLSVNRAFAQRNNTRNDYLLRALVSCGVCGLACGGIRNSQGYQYYRCVGKQSPIYSRHEEHCPARLSPAGQLDEAVWKDLCDLLTHPEPIAHALQRAHGGHWLPQEMQSRQQGLRRAHGSLSQQLDRLTEAYLSGIVPLEEYRRRRADTEQRQQALEEQQRQLDQHTNRQNELAGLAQSVEGFCQRIRPGLEQASFAQKRQLVELLIDRVLVTNTEIEIRYVVPTSPAGEKNHFSHLRSLYRTRSPCFEKTRLAGQRIQSLCQCPTNAGRD